jgi:signal transduction histidine kinase
MSAIKVMIVEDNTTVAKDLQGCLIDLGYEVTSIQVSGEDAVEKAEVECPNVVVMDIQLKDAMTGIEAAEQIHDRFNIPVVFLSAYSDRTLLEKAKKVGAFGYLIKPFEERELFATLEMAIYKTKAEKERQEMESRLAQMQKQEGLHRLASSIAHKFNNILQIPVGYYDLILERLPPDSECRTLVKKSKAAIDRAAKISQLMLVYVGQGQKIQPKVNLTSVISRAAYSLRENLNEQQSLKTSLSSNDLFVEADPDYLKEMIDNLLINAAEAIGDAAGKITISAQVVSGAEDGLRKIFPDFKFPPESCTLLEVSDTGCGMDKATQEKIFDPFFSTKFIGRGLGMAAVYGIVRGYEGAIAIESQPGEGTVVKIIFPCSYFTEPA